jgi:hypothetical protein
MVSMVTRVSEEQVLRKIKFDFMRPSADLSLRMLEDIESLFSHYKRKDLHVKELLQEAADLIGKHLRIREVTIGLRSHVDGLLRYEVMCGLRQETWAAHQTLAYDDDQFSNDDVYKGRPITKYSKLYLAESNPYAEGEEQTYSRPLMMQSRRYNIDDSVEGDYIDTVIPGIDDYVIGWIEVSGTRMGKLPDASAIRWLEVIAHILGAILVARGPQISPRHGV